VIVSSIPYFLTSYNLNEASTDAGGLEARYVIKAFIMIGFTFLLLQGIALMFRSIIVLTNQKFID
ncbi:MAG: hypothetical protein AAGI07_20545, partial [Bacteroidota bacterium]